MTEKNLGPRSAPETFKAGFETYLSPFTFRYGSPEMRAVWSQKRFWSGVRDVWIAAAETQQEVGLTTQEQVSDLKEHRYESLFEEKGKTNSN